MPENTDAKTWKCPCCGYVYNEDQGEPDNGFPAGTRFRDLPDDYTCPDCSVRYKEDFEPC